MAKLHISLVRMSHPDALTSTPRATPIGTPEVITTSPTSQTSTLAATAALLAGTTTAATAAGNPAGSARVCWRLANTGAEDVVVQFGSAPTATQTADFMVLADSVAYFAVGAAGEKVAVINVL